MIWWLLPGALAACLGWMVLTNVFFEPSPGKWPELVEGGAIAPTAAVDDGHDNIEAGRRGPRWSGGDQGIRRVSTTPDVMDHRRDSNVYGIIGDDGRIYLIELERTRMYRYPRSRRPVHLVRDDL